MALAQDRQPADSFSEPARADSVARQLPSLALDAGALSVTYYTDPLCSWSWAFEPQWRRLRDAYGLRLTWRYRMGGLLRDWQSNENPLSPLSRPSQMAPQWYQVRELSGMPLDEHIWEDDPPDSSYPACIAFHAAALQGAGIGERMLRRLREGVMLERKNIARRDVLLAIASDLEAEDIAQGRILLDQMDAERFKRDLDAPDVQDTFRHDLQDAALLGIGRFPTLIIQRTDGHGIGLVGYRPYAALEQAIASLIAPTGAAHERLIATETPDDRLAVERAIFTFLARWGSATVREIAECAGRDSAQIEAGILPLVNSGAVRRAGALYRLEKPAAERVVH